MSNYHEYIVLPRVPNAFAGDSGFVDYHWNEVDFVKCMRSVAFKNLKHYEKRIKQYVKDNLYYEIVLDNVKNDVSEIRSYNKSALEYAFVRPNILKINFAKNKQPIHSFSSSYDMHTIEYVKRLTFRVSNRVFINFESKMVDGSDECTRKVYLNANIDTNVDIDFVNADVDQYLSLLENTLA